MVMALVALVVAYLTALQIKVAVPSEELWHWTVGLWIVFLFFFIAPFRAWSEEREKVESFEEAARPKLEISDPFEVCEPKGAPPRDMQSNEWRLRIQNTSATLVKNCYVRQKQLVNNVGHASDVEGVRFKLNTDQPLIIQSYEHKQSFDLPPGASEVVSICGVNLNSNIPENVIMLYAIQGVGGQGIRNSIPPRFFPHTLVIEVCAENIAKPEEITYSLFFADRGHLIMSKGTPAAAELSAAARRR
jgi:hypothetical protein